MIKLTDEQQAFTAKVLANPQKVHVLTGEGGAGKTFTCAALASMMREGALFASPTHQAATVLRDELKAKDAVASVKTVASLLGNVPNFEEEPGGVNETSFVRGGSEGSFSTAAPQRGGLLVIDEASMVGELDVKQLLGRAFSRGLYVVVTGDPEQLQPVQMTSCWDFLETLIKAGNATRTHLTRNMRSTNDDLTGYINKVRKTGKLPAKAAACAAVTTYASKAAFTDALVEAVRAANGSPKAMPVGLAYRNSTVNALGSSVRAAMGWDAQWNAVGEVLRVTQPHEVLNWREEYERMQDEGMPQQEAFKAASERCREVRLQTGDLIRVVAVKNEVTFGAAWANLRAQVKVVTVEVILGELEGRSFDIKLAPVDAWTAKRSQVQAVLSECFDVARELNTAIKDKVEPKGKALLLAQHIVRSSKGKLTMGTIPSGRAWADGFYRVRGAVANVSSAVALTVHKAQGSGRRAVFIDATDLKGGPGSLLYVAVSRAREELHILK